MLKGILSISGQSGLFKLISQGKSSIIVENMETGKRLPASTTSRVSQLTDICMYTNGEDIKLEDVFMNIYNYTKGTPVLDAKKATAEELYALMDNVLPDWDKDRVYVSDLKKLFSWYNILIASDVKFEAEK